ncbi:hypothetical protein [Caldithrix abyssi]
MRHWKFTALLLLLFLASLSFSQKAEQAERLAADSLIKIMVSPDSVSLPDTVKMMNGNRLQLRFIFKNDHRWNNWAVDTTLSGLSDSLLTRFKWSRKPFKLTFNEISLKNKDAADKTRIKKYLQPGLAALALTCNWGSFYLKRVADDYYDQYRYTSDLQKMNHYYDRTRQFDRLSNALLTVSVVALSVYLYLILQ